MSKISGQLLISGQFQDICKISGISRQLGALSTLLYSTKNTLRGGHQRQFSPLPPTPKNIIGSFTFYMDALAQLAKLLRWLFTSFKQNVSGIKILSIHKQTIW